MILFIAGFVIASATSLVVTLLLVTDPATAATIIGFVSVSIRWLGILVAAAGLLTVAHTTWTRRLIGTGVLVGGSLVTTLLSWASSFLVAGIASSSGSIAATQSVASVTGYVFGIVSGVCWIGSWIIVRRGGALAWWVALPVGVLLPELAHLGAQLLWRLTAATPVAIVNIVLQVVTVVCFIGAVLFTEYSARRAGLKEDARESTDHGTGGTHPSAGAAHDPRSAPAWAPGSAPGPAPGSPNVPRPVPPHAPGLAPTYAPGQAPAHAPGQVPGQAPRHSPGQAPPHAPGQHPDQAPPNSGWS